MSTRPAVIPSIASLATGTVCLYEHDGRPLLGVVLGIKNKKYNLLNQRGREIELPDFRLCALGLKTPADLAGNTAIANFLEQTFERSNKLSDDINLELVWTVVQAEQRYYPSQELAELYFQKPSAEQHLALRLALLGDRIFFKRQEDGFSPRPDSTVQELKVSEQSRKEKQRTQQLALDTFSARLKDPQAPIPAEIEVICHTMLEIIAGCTEIDGARLRDAKDITDYCGDKLKLELRGSREQRMSTILQAVHILTPNTNLAFARKRYNWNRPAAVLETAEKLQLPQTVSEIQNLYGANRVDYSGLHTFTIDDVSTQDMDDAISIERSRDGYSLGIHISDVATFLQPGSLLDQEALKRATSIYAPERTANMLPDALSDDLFSLREGKLRLAMSCMLELNQRLEIVKADIHPSIIRVAKRYTYVEVDEMLYRPDSELHMLYNISSTLEGQRIEKGAFRAGKREIIAGPAPDGGLKLQEIDENSPARSTVSEMMVLANRVLAEYGARHKLPLIYRGQTSPDPDSAEHGHDIPEGPAQDYSQRSRLKKSFTSVTPARHASLALDAYIQATSPIRRYADIVNQRQLLAHLATGQVVHSAEDLEKLIEALSDPLAAAQSISKESKRFWLLRYIELLQSKNELLTGVVLRTDLRHPLVELRELVMPTLAKIEIPVRPGDILQFRIQRVDARNDILRLEVVQKLAI